MGSVECQDGSFIYGSPNREEQLKFLKGKSQFTFGKVELIIARGKSGHGATSEEANGVV